GSNFAPPWKTTLTDTWYATTSMIQPCFGRPYQALSHLMAYCRPECALRTCLSTSSTIGLRPGLVSAIQSLMTAWLPAGSGGLRVDFDAGFLAIGDLLRLRLRILSGRPGAGIHAGGTVAPAIRGTIPVDDLTRLETPAALIDVPRMQANI